MSSRSTHQEIPADVAVLIALQEEWAIFWPIVGSPNGVQDATTGRYVYRFEIPDVSRRPYRCVAMFMGDMGPGQATDATHVLLAFDPKLLVNLGIAAAIHDDLKLCDVVVADQIDDYLATAKAVDSGDDWTFEPRGSVYKSTFATIQTLVNLKYSHHAAFAAWQSECVDPQGSEEPALHRAHLASGPVLAASQQFSAWVRRRDGQIKALEMEAAGMMLAAHQRSNPTQTLVLRGISDFGDERKAQLDRTSGGVYRHRAMANATHLLIATMTHGLLPRHPGDVVPVVDLPPAGEPLAVIRDMKERLAQALRGDPGSLTRHLGARLKLAEIPHEAPQAYVARLAAAVDDLGDGPAAAERLILACYAALSDVTAEQPGERSRAKQILRRVLGEWLPQRYGRTQTATSRLRCPERDGVADLDVDTPNRELAEPAAAFADARPATYRTHVQIGPDGMQHPVVRPRGEVPMPVAIAAEILTPHERAQRLAHAIADQLPRPVPDDPRRRLQDTREWLAFLRAHGAEQGPKHLALTSDERDSLSEAALVHLKSIYPALRIIGLGGRAGDEEARIRFPLITIFMEDDV